MALLLLAAQLHAATREYDAEAAPVPQIDSITIGGTYAATETVACTIGNATLTVTLGTDTTTTSQVADALKRAINASTIDENKVGAEKRSAAGQLLPEFRDVEAIIDPASSSVVLVRSKVAGVPFGTPSGGNMTVAEGSASGTIVRASVQAATGPWHWNNAVNWSSNTLPVNGDTTVFVGTTNGPKYGLPTSLEATLNVHQSFVGTIGLAQLNTANGATYPEYRTRFVILDDTGSGTSITHLIGLGDGAGSPLINVLHSYAGTGLVVNAVVYNTGTPTIAGTKALNLVIRNEDSSGTVSISKGSVNIGQNFLVQPKFATLNLGFRTNQASDVDCLTTNHAAALTVNQSGGNLLFVETASPSGDRTFNLYGGTTTARDIQTSGAITATLAGGTLTWDSTKTITTLIVSGSGILDLEKDGPGRGVTITNADLFKGASFLDRYGRATLTNGLDYNRCSDADVTVRVGDHKRRTYSGVP